MIESKYNMNIKQCDKYLNGKSWTKASNVTIYKYSNGQK